MFVLSSFLALGFTGTFLGKTLSAGGQGPAPPNSRPQPALLSIGGQTLKPQPAAWPPGWARLLLLCSGLIGAGTGLGLATGGGAGPSACPWLRSFGAENPVLAGLDVLQTPTPSLGLWREGAGRLMCGGQWGQSRRPARDHVTRVPEGHAGDWGVLLGGGSHRGGPLGAKEQVGIIVWASQGWGGEGSQGREVGGVANLRRPGVSSPTARAGERAARVWRRVGEGPGSRLGGGGPRRNGLERGALRLRNVGQSGRVPAPHHEPP